MKQARHHVTLALNKCDSLVSIASSSTTGNKRSIKNRSKIGKDKKDAPVQATQAKIQRRTPRQKRSRRRMGTAKTPKELNAERKKQKTKGQRKERNAEVIHVQREQKSRERKRAGEKEQNKNTKERRVKERKERKIEKESKVQRVVHSNRRRSMRTRSTPMKRTEENNKPQRGIDSDRERTKKRKKERHSDTGSNNKRRRIKQRNRNENRNNRKDTTIRAAAAIDKENLNATHGNANAIIKKRKRMYQQASEMSVEKPPIASKPTRQQPTKRRKLFHSTNYKRNHDTGRNVDIFTTRRKQVCLQS